MLRITRHRSKFSPLTKTSSLPRPDLCPLSRGKTESEHDPKKTTAVGMECDAKVTNELLLAAAAANQLASWPEIQPDTCCTGPIKPPQNTLQAKKKGFWLGSVSCTTCVSEFPHELTSSPHNLTSNFSAPLLSCLDVALCAAGPSPLAPPPAAAFAACAVCGRQQTKVQTATSSRVA